MERKQIQGYYVDLINFQDAVKHLVSSIENKKSVHVITINPEIIEQAQKNNELSTIIKNAEFIVADGMGIKLALKFKGINQERIPGVDLARQLVNECEKNNFNIALIGAKEEVINKTVNNLKEENEKLNISYFRNGYFSKEDEDEIIRNITNEKPRLVLVALGAPKQEFFIHKCKEKHPEAVYIGVGGSFDVWAKTVERAPEFYRKIGCEWLYRTIKQPERIKRIYKTLPVFVFKAIIEAVKSNG